MTDSGIDHFKSTTAWGDFKMKRTRRSHRAGLVLTMPFMVAGCLKQDIPKGDPYSHVGDKGRLIGLEGVGYNNQSYETVNGGTPTRTDHEGTTDASGLFPFGVSKEKSCQRESADKEQTCSITSSTYTQMAFQVCGVDLPHVPGPDTELDTPLGRLPSYTIWDFSSDATVVKNIATVLLMLNSNSGDPAKTGIRISPPKGGCGSIDWASADIRRDADLWQQRAQADGQAHPWPSDEAVTDYLSQTYICTHAGYHFGSQQETGSSPARWGNFQAVIDTQGHLVGHMDFSADATTEPYHDAIPFSGTITPVAAGNTFTHIVLAGSPAADMRIGIEAFPTKLRGTWQTADATGTTEHQDYSWSVPDLGLSTWAWEDVPKYRFVATNVSYLRPGGTAPETFLLEMEVSYNNELSGGLWPWPPPRRDSNYDYHGKALQWHGSISGNTLDIKWYDNGTASTREPIKLTLDPATNSLTGTFLGKDGGQFLTFTNEAPLRGCRL